MKDKFAYKRIVLTGASGGIGQHIAKELAKHPVKLALVGRNQSKLDAQAKSLTELGCETLTIPCDITDAAGRQQLVNQMESVYGGIDILINNAGTSSFASFSQLTDEEIEQLISTNITATMLLTKSVLPMMRAQKHGHIVNIGSTFGSIAFAYFAAYSASKFAIRGFSEALRRELAPDNIKVSYIAPRAVKTSLNSERVYAMAKETRMNMDQPQLIAKKIVKAIGKEKKDVYLGFPESLFVRINALLPRVVDNALKKQVQIMQKHV